MHTGHTIPLPGRAPLILGERALIMGILNVTPDSFSDGGRHVAVEEAVAHARLMVAEGADMIDIGGESTRPGAEPVPVQEELDRVMPVIDALVAEGIGVPISIDTMKPLVADQAIQAGATIINDVTGLQGAPEMAAIAALYEVPVVAMHWDKTRDRSAPIVAAVRAWLERSCKIAAAAGVASDRLILDPGFGFAKNMNENYTLLNGLDAFADRPLLVGTSRKSMIGRLLNVPAEERMAGTVATNVLGYMKGGHIFRVHDVRAHREALTVAQAALYGPPVQEELQS